MYRPRTLGPQFELLSSYGPQSERIVSDWSKHVIKVSHFSFSLKCLDPSAGVGSSFFLSKKHNGNCSMTWSKLARQFQQCACVPVEISSPSDSSLQPYQHSTNDEFDKSSLFLGTKSLYLSKTKCFQTLQQRNQFPYHQQVKSL